MMNSNGNTASFLGKNKKKKFIHQLGEGEERIPQGAPRIAAQMRQVAHSLRDNDYNNNQEVAEAVNR